MLLLIKKLLGALKQSVRKDLDGILEDILDFEVEDELKSIAEGRELGAEDEMDVVAVVTPQSDGTIKCFHTHKTVRKIPADGKGRKLDVLQTQCRRCGEDIGKPRVCGSPFKGTLKDPKKCRHEEAEWKEGEEGQTAICFECEEVAPDPGKYKWGAVGLEQHDKPLPCIHVLVVPV